MYLLLAAVVKQVIRTTVDDWLLTTDRRLHHLQQLLQQHAASCRTVVDIYGGTEQNVVVCYSEILIALINAVPLVWPN